MTTEPVTAPDAPVEPERPEPTVLKADVERMFRWSEYVHVGIGADGVPAEDVPDHGAGDTDPMRFHAWVRLPNPYQHREIREKALAAKARLTRRLKDPESDAYVILEAELDELREGGDTALPAIVDTLLQKDWAEDYLAAMSEVNEREEFERIDHDQERLNELDALPEDQRPADEYRELGEHVMAYSEAINKALEDARVPRREALSARPIADLIDLLRTQRIEQQGTEEYLHWFGSWEIIAGTYAVEPDVTGRPTRHLFKHADELAEADAEVVFALKAAFDKLRIAQQEAATGNS